MTMEWLLIPVFILCALIMKLFVRVVDFFIAHNVIPEDVTESAKAMGESVRILSGNDCSKGVRVSIMAENEGSTVRSTDLNTDGSLKENAASDAADHSQEHEITPEKLSFSELLDKFRKKRNVRNDQNEAVIEIGTARPMQIRIHNNE